MLQAEIDAKFSSTSEDLLTSSVIGSLQFLSSPAFLVAVLQKAMNTEGQHPQLNEEVQDAQFYFWPRLPLSEPDVIVLLKTSAETLYVVCIEAKYFSKKSSEEDKTVAIEERTVQQRDQLAREYEDIHTQEFYRKFSINPSEIAGTILLYLTNDTALPVEELKQSSSSIQISNADQKHHLYWLPWKEFYSAIHQSSSTMINQDRRILDILRKYLEKKELVCFTQPAPLQSVTLSTWAYVPHSNKALDWSSLQTPEPLAWKYGGDAHECK
ncbi:hypothetical protein [Bacillus rhizoplanae]|uniref:hypothetical protein n=1 Tax=Bacillus rhizoplanae TaxID=2880966 RepID=UPI003D1AFFE9